MSIDPNIKQKADDIRNKVYGKEVRESLASGIEEISKDVVETVDRQGAVEEQFQDVIDNTTNKDVISAPEIIAARNGEANLKTRIDKDHQEVTAQLAQTVRLITPEMSQDEIQTVLDAAGTIKFTKGIYSNFVFKETEHMANVAFLIKSNSKIIIDAEAIIKTPANSLETHNVFYIENKENVTVTGGGKIQGDRNEHTGIGGEWGCGIYISGGNNIAVDGIISNDFWGDGLTVHRFPRGREEVDRSNMPKNVTIANNVFENNRRQGTSIVGLKGGYIYNNVFSNTNGTLPAAGLDLETDRHCAIEDIIITGNTFKNNEEEGILISKRISHGDEASIKDVKVSDNFVTGNKRGIQVGQSSKISVSGNTISDNKGSGVVLVSSNECAVLSNYVENNESHGVHVWQSNKNIIAYNKINKSGLYGALVTDDSSNNLIHSNDIEENEMDGIGVRTNSNHNSVKDNKVSNNGLTNKEAQIRVYSGARQNTLTGNICRGLETKYGIYVGDATSRLNKVYSNDCQSSGTVKGLDSDVSNFTQYHIGNIENDGTWDSDL